MHDAVPSPIYGSPARITLSLSLSLSLLATSWLVPPPDSSRLSSGLGGASWLQQVIEQPGYIEVVSFALVLRTCRALVQAGRKLYYKQDPTSKHYEQ